MSSALDEDTQKALADGSAATRAMLRAAQKDLQKVFIVFLVGFLGTFYALRLVVWDFLKGVTISGLPAETSDAVEIIAQTPFDVILLQAKISLVAGIIIALPLFIYFARDALRERELWPQAPVARWKLAAVALLSLALFVAGLAYGYYLFFPIMFAFLASNAMALELAPTYSIVMWAEFIFFLTLSFGIAAQMPLFVTALSYAEIVPYETFRDKWRHAVVVIFVFGAVFSPPDPFTQIMWAVPLIALYGASLYLAKVVVTARRGSEQLSFRRTLRARWNALLGLVALGGAVSYAFYEYGGVETVNEAFAWAGSRYRVFPAGEGLDVDPLVATALYGGLFGLALAFVGLLFFAYRDLDAGGHGPLGEPTAIDLEGLDAEGVRAAPPEAFLDLSEEEALAMASRAMEAEDTERARAILDRYDEAEETREAAAEAEGGAEDGAEAAADAGEEIPAASDDIGDRASRASGTFLSELTEGERDEDDIGGYYKDIVFIVDALRSRSFRIVGFFMLVMAGTFVWLYQGGLGDVLTNFLARLPSEVSAENVTVITLHPVEALLFAVKFSVLIGLVAVLPLMAWYAWPALRDRGFVRGRRYVIFGWAALLTAGMVGGFALGYLYIAPAIISYLVADALAADMIISYRVNDFFWLIVFTTAGIGFLADVPIFMVLLNTAGIPYKSFRGRWREVTVGILTFAAIFTPADIITMFLMTIPLMVAYGVGLLLLFLVTFGGRRNLAPPAEVIA